MVNLGCWLAWADRFRAVALRTGSVGAFSSAQVAASRRPCYTGRMDSSLPPRILLGPGPSMVDPRVYRAMSAPITGHMDPRFLALMKEVREKLRRVFRADHEVTIPISGTGSAGMEAALV